MSKITMAYGALKLAIKSNAPTIMVVGGVASMTAGAVAAGVQTLKVEKVLAKHTPQLEKIQKGLDLKVVGYTDNDARADRFKVYSRAGLDLTKVYAVPAVFLVGGACLIFGGHRIMLQRNATLAIAFTGLKEAFDSYRGRVVDELGHEVDQAFYHGTKDGVSILKKGKLSPDAELDWDAMSGDEDPYNRVFEQGASESWQNDLGTNKMFLHNQQRFAQERLSRRGYLYLSEVYEALGFPESDISRVVGWKVTRNADGSKNFPVVDFGLDKPHFDDFKWNRINAIALDFNCMGLIVGGKVQKILEKA